MMGQVFEVLSIVGIIDAKLADRMKKTVGFRNLAAHNYEDINWAIVFSIATQRLSDFKSFAKAVAVFTFSTKAP